VECGVSERLVDYRSFVAAPNLDSHREECDSVMMFKIAHGYVVQVKIPESGIDSLCALIDGSVEEMRI
jgi:hypothetical protein